MTPRIDNKTINILPITMMQFALVNTRQTIYKYFGAWRWCDFDGICGTIMDDSSMINKDTQSVQQDFWWRISFPISYFVLSCWKKNCFVSKENILLYRERERERERDPAYAAVCRPI